MLLGLFAFTREPGSPGGACLHKLPCLLMITQVVEQVPVTVVPEEIGHHRTEGTDSDA